MKKIAFLSSLLIAFPALAALDATQLANYDAAVASYKARAEAMKVNNAAAAVRSSLPSGTSSANIFGNLALKTTGSDLALATKGALTVGGKPLVIDVETKLLKPSLMGALGRFAGKVVPVLNFGVALYDLTKELDGWDVDKDPDTGKPRFTELVKGQSCVQDCFEYSIIIFSKTLKSSSYQQLCQSALSAQNANDNPLGYSAAQTSCSASYWGYTQSKNGQIVFGGGEPINKVVIPPYDTSKLEPRTPEEWAAEIANDPTPSPIIGKLIKDVLSSGEQIDTGPTTATGPATTPGTTTTTTGTAPDGTPTTTTTINTNHFTYEGDNITHNTTSITQTCAGAGSCSTSTTTTENEAPADTPAGEPSPSDCEKNPDSIGCSKYGNPEDLQLPKTASPVSVELKHFSGTGACPSPLSFTIPTGTYAIAFNPICDQLIYLKALILALAGIMAAYILADSFKVG